MESLENRSLAEIFIDSCFHLAFVLFVLLLLTSDLHSASYYLNTNVTQIYILLVEVLSQRTQNFLKQTELPMQRQPKKKKKRKESHL